MLLFLLHFSPRDHQLSAYPRCVLYQCTSSHSCTCMCTTHRHRLVPLCINQLLVLLLFPGGNEVVDEVAAGVVAAMQHMLTSVEGLLEEERLGGWHHKGFRYVVGMDCVCVCDYVYVVVCGVVSAYSTSLYRYMYYDHALNAVKATPTTVKALSKDTQALTVSAMRDAHHVAEQWHTGVSTEMVRVEGRRVAMVYGQQV